MSLTKAIFKSKLPMESAVALTAGWIFFGEMIKLQELLALISDNLEEWQNKETLDWIGDQVRDDMTEKWVEPMYGRAKAQPCKSCVTKRPHQIAMNLDLRDETDQDSIKNASER